MARAIEAAGCPPEMGVIRMKGAAERHLDWYYMYRFVM